MSNTTAELVNLSRGRQEYTHKIFSNVAVKYTGGKLKYRHDI
jgi:hypothetical protein